jgi:hypothetical protein
MGQWASAGLDHPRVRRPAIQMAPFCALSAPMDSTKIHTPESSKPLRGSFELLRVSFFGGGGRGGQCLTHDHGGASGRSSGTEIKRHAIKTPATW